MVLRKERSLPDVNPALVIDILLSALFGMLLWELRKHIADDAEAHKLLRDDAEKRAKDGDHNLEKRVERIEKYLDGRLPK